MKYDFETVIDRYNLGSVKWKRMYNDDLFSRNVMDTIPMSMADMEFLICPKISNGISKFVSNSVLGYTSCYSAYDLAVVNWMKKKHNWKIKSNWIVRAPSVVTGFTAALRGLLNEGDSVAINTPIYYPMLTAIKNSNLKEVNIKLINNNNDYKFDFKKFEYEIKNSKIKALLFCSPHNPTGKVWNIQDLKKIGEMCVENNILIICDEIWNDIIMPGYKHTVLANISEEISNLTITCTSPSKTFNIAGLKVSNIIVSDDNKRKRIINELKNMTANSVNILGYKACEIAYNESEDWLNELISVIDKNRKICETFFDSVSLSFSKSGGTYTFWVDLSSLALSNNQLENFLKKEAGIYPELGYKFGERNNQYIRLNIAMPTKLLIKQLNRFKKSLKAIKHKDL